MLGGHTLVGPGLRLLLPPGATRPGAMGRAPRRRRRAAHRADAALASRRGPISGPRVELRRHEPPDLGEAGEDAALVGRIRAEIAANGPMPFARFMELALYDPDGGYYRSAEARPGRGGDFLTAPELHPIFGRDAGPGGWRVWERLGRPDPFVIREHGAGDGRAGRRRSSRPAGGRRSAMPSATSPVEVDDRAGSTRSRTRLDGRRAGGASRDTSRRDAVRRRRARQRGPRCAAGPPRPPARRRTARAGRRPRADGAFVEVEVEPTTPALAARLAAEGIELADGQTAEICLALDDWVARRRRRSAPRPRSSSSTTAPRRPSCTTRPPARRDAAGLRPPPGPRRPVPPRRAPGPDRARRRHGGRAGGARAAGLTTLGITTQAEALMGLGIEERLRAIQADPATTIEDYTRSARRSCACSTRRDGPFPGHGLRPRLAGRPGARDRLRVLALALSRPCRAHDHADRPGPPTRANALLPRAPARHAWRGRRTTTPPGSGT